ncbi:MAG: FAD-dependent oxidoreductase [bacterium]|nr:FAD-dependent oxidoreductase [bacterium]
MNEYCVARIDELPEGQMKSVVVGELPIVLINYGGRIHALGGKCPHYGAPLGEGSLLGGRIFCPWHQSLFDARAGDLVHPPALDGLTRFDARVEGGDVFVAIPEGAQTWRTMPMCACEPDEDRRLFTVIGAGGAGAAAVETLRQEGFKGRIVMIGIEDRLPYDRPNCSKGLLSGEASDDWMPLRSEDFYKQYGIERMRKRVLSLDVRTREIKLEGNQQMTADAVLIATGARPRSLDVPGIDLKGIHYLRTWSDCAAIVATAEKARRALIAGAGFIALEAAASLRHRGLAVTIVAPAEAPMARVFGAPVGEMLRRLHEAKGVRFRLGRTVRRFIGDHAVRETELEDGTREKADLVVIGIGVRPATDFVRGAHLASDGSLEVDENLRVAEGVYAAGDIARYPEPRLGESVRIEHWRLAQQHGRAAARAMAAPREAPPPPFTAVPFFWTRQYDLSLHYAGAAPDWDGLLVAGDLEARDFLVFYAVGERLLAAAGTRAAAIDAFSELLRLGRIPTTADLRGKSADEAAAWLKERQAAEG